MALLNTAELIISVQAQNMKRSMEALDKLRVETVRSRRTSCMSAVSQSQEYICNSSHSVDRIKRSLSTSHLQLGTSQLMLAHASSMAQMAHVFVERTKSEVGVGIEPVLVSKIF